MNEWTSNKCHECVFLPWNIRDKFTGIHQISNHAASRTSIGPIVASNSFSLDGVIESGKEPITIRFVGLPEVPDFVATTRFALLSPREDFRSSEPLRECLKKKKIPFNNDTNVRAKRPWR